MNITDIFNEDNEKMSLSEQRLREAEQRKWGLGLENSDPYFSEEKYNGINATIAGDSYYNPDECVKQAMIKFQSQGEQAIKAVKVRREGQGQFMCTEKDIADIKSQFPEGKRNVAGPGPLKIMRMRRIKKWCGAICCFDVEESQMGYFNEKRKVYTLNDVKVFFYHKNSDGIGTEIILKNKFMRLRKRAGKSKEIKTSKESVDPTKSVEGEIGKVKNKLTFKSPEEAVKSEAAQRAMKNASEFAKNKGLKIATLKEIKENQETIKGKLKKLAKEKQGRRINLMNGDIQMKKKVYDFTKLKLLPIGSSGLLVAPGQQNKKGRPCEIYCFFMKENGKFIMKKLMSYFNINAVAGL